MLTRDQKFATGVSGDDEMEAGGRGTYSESKVAAVTKGPNPKASVENTRKARQLKEEPESDCLQC